jgi:GntR family transcriptional regulator, transcriptional repressor for pyruvate dehydrogenase complex
MNNTKKSVLVANDVLDSIRSGKYAPVGSKLPSEPELAKQMGVSRNAVREALTALQVVGIIESRVGDGTYVTSAPPDIPFGAKGFGFNKNREDLFDVWEARKEIEVTIVRMAVRTATEKAIQRIRYYVDEMYDVLQREDWRQYLKASKNFHFAIAQAADNALLEEVILPIITFTENYMLQRVSPDRLIERFKASLKEHEEIVNAIAERDQEKAVRLITNHFDKASAYYNRTPR